MDASNESLSTARPGRLRGMRPGPGFGLGRVLGVEIRIDWSLLIIFALITFNLGAGVFPAWHPGWGPVLSWSVAIGAALLFFGSVLAHELTHAVVARRRGIPVRRITLFLFGGMAQMDREPPSPSAEFWMAIAGPIASVVIGALAIGAGAWLARDTPGLLGALTRGDAAAREALARIGPVATLLLWLGPINIVLGLFNVVPGFPLDGGRVLRAILWGATGDLIKATRWAAGAGRAFAWVLIVFGAMSFFAGQVGQGIWLLLIGWFLNNAARMSYQQLLVRQALEDVPIRRIMRTHLDRVSPDLPLDRFVREHLMASDQQAFPVESDGRVLGLIDLDDLRRVEPERWSRTRVDHVMTPADRITKLSPEADAEQALSEFARHDGDQLAVFEGPTLLGLVRRRDVLKWLTLHGGALAGSR